MIWRKNIVFKTQMLNVEIDLVLFYIFILQKMNAKAPIVE